MRTTSPWPEGDSLRFFSAVNDYERLAREYAGKEIADVGCGRKKFPGSVGIDIRGNSSADVQHDLLTFPYPFDDNAFHLLVCRHCIEHLPDTFAVINEFYRLVKPGGRIVLEYPHFSWHEAYRHPQHCHWFSSGSFDYFHPDNEHYVAKLKMRKKMIYFGNTVMKILGVQFFANRFRRLWESKLAFILPATVVYLEMEVVK